MVENAITKVARIAAHAAQGLVYKDSAGKEQTILPTGDKNMIDISGLSIGNGSGGNTSGGDNPNYPNYVPGLLSDGSLTGRKVEWTGTTSASTVTTAKFSDDLGTTLNLAGDGLQFVPYMNKTLITRGVAGNSSLVPIQYDKDNKANSGNFVTTQYLPISINKKDLITGNDLVVIFDGIGENDESATELKSPELHIKYNSGDNSVDISQVSGYAYDNLTDTKTGEKYDLGVSMINTFYTQKPVAQLTSDIGLFSGASSGEIKLSGTGNYFDNLNTGINITTDEYLSFTPINAFTNYELDNLRILSSVLNIPTKFTISKNDLIVGNRINIPGQITQPKYLNVQITTSNSIWHDYNVEVESLSFEDTFIQVNGGSIQICLTVKIKAAVSQHAPWESTGTLKVLTIKKV